MLNYFLNLLLIGVWGANILGFIVIQIYFSDRPLEWTAVVGGVLGGLGAIAACVIAGLSIRQSRLIFSKNQVTTERYRLQEDLRILINKGENCIKKLTCEKDIVSFAEGDNVFAEEAIEKLVDLYLHGSMRVVILEFPDKYNVGSLYNIYRLLLLKIYNDNNDAGVLEEIFLSSGVPKCLFSLLFILALRKDDDEISHILYEKKLIDEFNLNVICVKLVRNVVDINEKTGEKDIVDISLMLNLIKKYLSTFESNFIAISKYTSDNIGEFLTTFNSEAKSVGSNVVASYDASTEKFVIKLD